MSNTNILASVVSVVVMSTFKNQDALIHNNIAHSSSAGFDRIFTHTFLY